MVCDKVYNAREIRLSSDGKFDRNGVGFEPFVHHTDSVVEVCARDVHLVYESKTGYAIFVGLAPYRFGLRLDAALGAKQCDCTVKDTKASFDFNGKVNVTRGIDNVYTMVFQYAVVAAEVMVIPLSCSCSIQSIVAVPSCVSPSL